MKGGKRRVKKGFAMNTPEKQRELVNRRWEKYRENIGDQREKNNNSGTNTQQEEQSDKH